MAYIYKKNTNELLSMDRFAKNLITQSPFQEKNSEPPTVLILACA